MEQNKNSSCHKVQELSFVEVFFMIYSSSRRFSHGICRVVFLCGDNGQDVLRVAFYLSRL